ncbi:hypothetical protein ARMSODRAFT_978478 [Armillaria solidipes]|uniref:Uncharacterized protein n=1 Tax=Armillaria solidipes TaxID=1076256 RepID=A0A2H3B3D7_9AGAR|nr:hypothetical protein ARMSODRAFT_978478 [Armillaria solidipes]
MTAEMIKKMSRPRDIVLGFLHEITSVDILDDSSERLNGSRVILSDPPCVLHHLAQASLLDDPTSLLKKNFSTSHIERNHEKCKHLMVQIFSRSGLYPQFRRTFKEVLEDHRKERQIDESEELDVNETDYPKNSGSDARSAGIWFLTLTLRTLASMAKVNTAALTITYQTSMKSRWHGNSRHRDILLQIVYLKWYL